MDELHRETGFWTLCDKSVDLFGLQATIQDTIIHSIRHYEDSSCCILHTLRIPGDLSYLNYIMGINGEIGITAFGLNDHDNFKIGERMMAQISWSHQYGARHAKSSQVKNLHTDYQSIHDWAKVHHTIKHSLFYMFHCDLHSQISRLKNDPILTYLATPNPYRRNGFSFAFPSSRYPRCSQHSQT